MSTYWSLLLVLLGVLVEARACHVGTSLQVKKIVEDISKDLDLESAPVSANPPFIGVFRSIDACQNREEVKLVAAALRVYGRVFESFLHGVATRNATGDAARGRRLRDQVVRLKTKTDRMRHNLLHRSCPPTQDVLRKLDELQEIVRPHFHT
ncbi:interferon gamma isoform X3 [Stigmatopora nigra]